MQRLNPNAQPHAARVRDAAGKVLEVGDEVLVITNKALMRVAEIKPLLDPGAPPNAMMVTLVSRVVVAAPRDSGIEDLYVLRHAAEIGDKLFAAAQEQDARDEASDDQA